MIFAVIALLVGFVASSRHTYAEGATPSTTGEHIITLHDDGVDKGFITKKSTLREAFAEAHIRLDSKDRTEPGLDEPLTANSYQVNIYRARPVVVRDSGSEIKVLTSYRTPKQIAAEASITLHDEDTAVLSPSTDPISDGATEVMVITRATEFSFDFYGKTTTSYTQAKTVGDMLKQKGIVMGTNDDITPATTAPIAPGMQVRLWRNGVQTVTVDEEVAYDTKQIQDVNQVIGYKQIQTAGQKGARTVTYEIDMQNGVEVSRKEINSVTTKQPTEQVEVVGVKSNGNGLTKSKGVLQNTDSQGITHRETYYDLNMSTVVRYCGGTYSVRADGVKVDQDGYILVAANLALYPRCSLVETSLGLGKVYDTGGFVAVHPTGFDLATDWSNYDGV
jgi:uncharacterized protein YabE (DUF348 family)